MAETQEGAENKVSHMESKIKSAMFSRASYFREQADSLTLEGVRRLLEKDLGLGIRELDSHKRFVKHWLNPCIESADLDKLPENEEDAGENGVSSTGEVKQTNEVQTKKEIDEPDHGSEEKMEDSPVLGLMTGPKKPKTDPDLAEDTKSKGIPSESTIKKAIWARASHLKENAENVTLVGLRRLLEEDLGLEKHTLDPFKKFISEQVDQVLESPDVPETTASQKKKNNKKQASGKASSISSEEAPSSGSDRDEVDEDVVVKKKSTPKGKLQKSTAVKKRKRAEEVTKGARKKQNKVSKSASGSSEENGADVSGDDNSEASAEKPVKKKEAPTSSYGKKVEHLKSVIKSCGASIPPSIYKRVKQAPEHKREASLIKELEEILAKEGLSSNPSEKEIKEVKKRKEKARELEGIDTSNIVSSSRRRSTASFVPPPKPELADMSESESEESENEEEDEDEVVVDEEEEVEEDQENGGNDSQSEESEEANGDSD